MVINLAKRLLLNGFFLHCADLEQRARLPGCMIASSKLIDGEIALCGIEHVIGQRGIERKPRHRNALLATKMQERLGIVNGFGDAFIL